MSDANKKWKYVHDDESKEKPSWKCLDHYVRKVNNEKQVFWIKNPNFTYSHLSAWGKNDIIREEYQKFSDKRNITY